MIIKLIKECGNFRGFKPIQENVVKEEKVVELKP
jgi:hypothetical protein